MLNVMKRGASQCRVAALCAAAIMSLATDNACFGAILRVDDDAVPGGDGSSWPMAFDDLQLALAAAAAGDEIWVASGTYAPTGPGGDRMISFELVNGVALYGGFAGFEIFLDMRDWQVNETILTGDLNGDDGPDFENNGENSYHVVAARVVGAAARLDGFTVIGGNANWIFDPDNLVEWIGGGGMYIDGASPIVEHCNFTGNDARRGGGIDCDEASPSIRRCTFRHNHALSGGGVYGYAATVQIIECTFIENFTTAHGAAIRGYLSSSVSVVDSQFQSNVAQGVGAAIACRELGSLEVHGCSFDDNRTTGGGGGGIATSYEVSAQITESIFRGNAAGGGGGILINSGSALIRNCAFFGNDAGSVTGAAGAGGGFAVSGYEPVTLINCAFGQNTANFAGGGAVLAAPSTVINCTFFGNTCGGSVGGGGIYAGGGPDTTILNSILWGNGPDQIETADFSAVYAGFSNIQGGWPGSNNIDANPLFVQPLLDDLRLAFGSPCLDAGDNSLVPPDVTTDLAGNPRIQNGVVDMGAYEGAFEPLPPADGEDDLDQGEIVILVPDGGGYDPLEQPAAIFANMSGPDDAQVMLTQFADTADSDAGGYSELSWVLDLDTSLADGQFFLQLTIPFTVEDLDGADPLELDLTAFNPSTGLWELAVAANTVNSPGHDSPIGDRFAVEGDTMPAFGNQFGDHGVFFNPSTGQGVAWANLDHAGEFAMGIRLCIADIASPSDGVVNLLDLAALFEAWGSMGVPGADPADLDGDGLVNISDLLLLLEAWGACP